MCQRDVGFFRHLPIAYADKKCGPQSLGGRHGITPTGRAIPSVVAPQQSHRPLHPTREVRHTLGIVEPHPYLRLGYEGCIAISGSTTRGCIAILGSIKRVYSQFRFSAPKCIAISGRSKVLSLLNCVTLCRVFPAPSTYVTTFLNFPSSAKLVVQVRLRYRSKQSVPSISQLAASDQATNLL